MLIWDGTLRMFNKPFFSSASIVLFANLHNVQIKITLFLCGDIDRNRLSRVKSHVTQAQTQLGSQIGNVNVCLFFN